MLDEASQPEALRDTGVERGLLHAAPDTPFFPADSMMRRVHQEGVLILGGGRALLMQIAHPAVAAGVAGHSSYRGRKLDRLVRTLRSTFAIVFGTHTQAYAAAGQVNRLHRRVNGAGYDATDPELLCWVLATLIDTTLLMHNRFVRPLTQVEANTYYQDAKRLAPLFGLSAASMPRDIDAHCRYVHKMIASLRVSEPAQEISRELFRPSPGLELPLWLVKQLTAGLLPVALRRQFGLDWGPSREAAMQAASLLTRAYLPRLPAPLRAPPRFLLPDRHGRLSEC